MVEICRESKTGLIVHRKPLSDVEVKVKVLERYAVKDRGEVCRGRSWNRGVPSRDAPGIWQSEIEEGCKAENWCKATRTWTQNWSITRKME